MNTSSKIMTGGKDIVKIEGRELLELETNKIAIISPNATINIIRNYEVIQKYRVVLPKEIINIIKCSRPSCITNDLKETKGLNTKFRVIEKNPIVIECCYCDEQIKEEDISTHMNY
jgi:aspartate carbamoyltransferase regulatory subunit